MLPEENEHENCSEEAHLVSVVDLPQDLTGPESATQFYFLICMIHGKKCLGGTDVRDYVFCASKCYTLKIPELTWFNAHLVSCDPEQCDVNECQEARATFAHWGKCFEENCKICSPTIRYIITAFCTYLKMRGPQYDHDIDVLLNSTERELKVFINRSI